MANEASWSGFRRMGGVQPLIETPKGEFELPSVWWRPRRSDMNDDQWLYWRLSNYVGFLLSLLIAAILYPMHLATWAYWSAVVAVYATWRLARLLGIHLLRDK